MTVGHDFYYEATVQHSKQRIKGFTDVHKVEQLPTISPTNPENKALDNNKDLLTML